MLKRCLALLSVLLVVQIVPLGTALAQAPSRAELEEIVFHVKGATRIAGPAAERVLGWLNDEVGEYMDAGRLAPLYVKLGLTPRLGLKAFTEPAETFCALSLAYPYLSPSLQTRVKSFLASEFEDYPPHKVARYPMDSPDFERREVFAISDEKKSAPGGYVREGHMISRLYSLWAYAYYVGEWGRVEGEWSEVKSIFNSFVGTWDNSAEDVNQNRYLSGLIAYIRIAHHVGDTVEVNRGLDELQRLVPGRLANAQWRGAEAARCTYEYGAIWPSGRPAWDGQQWRGMFVSVVRDIVKIPQFSDLTPEVARLLRSYAPGAMDSCIDHTEKVLSSWYIAANENCVHTYENFVDSPDNTHGLFLMMALVGSKSGEDLTLYASAPLSKGDLYHIEKLVYAIQAYGEECSEDLRTLYRECTPEGFSIHPDMAEYGDTLSHEITVLGTGRPLTVTAPIPSCFGYVPGSAQVSPDVGELVQVSASVLRWTGLVDAELPVEITYQATATTRETGIVRSTVSIDDSGSIVEWSADVRVNFRDFYLPFVSLARFGWLDLDNVRVSAGMPVLGAVVHCSWPWF